jgi:hypothetical protein
MRIALEWKCNAERRERERNQHELQRQYPRRWQLYRRGIQRDVEQHDQRYSNVIRAERNDLPLSGACTRSEFKLTGYQQAKEQRTPRW